jgi:hypothetical protein
MLFCFAVPFNALLTFCRSFCRRPYSRLLTHGSPRWSACWADEGANSRLNAVAAGSHAAIFRARVLATFSFAGRKRKHSGLEDRKCVCMSYLPSRVGRRVPVWCCVKFCMLLVAVEYMCVLYSYIHIGHVLHISLHCLIVALARYRSGSLIYPSSFLYLFICSESHTSIAVNSRYGHVRSGRIVCCDVT